MSKYNIADESARARKILAKNQAWKFSSHNVRKMELLNVNDPQVGENAVLCLVGPFGATQYTLCHPIGLTDLEPEDWVLIRTDEIPATLSRSEDPNKEAINKLRAAARQSDLVKNNLLVLKEEGGSKVLYYPSEGSTPRNALLNAANAEKKARISSLKRELSLLGKEDGSQKQHLNSEIQKASNILQYLPESVSAEEIKIRQRINAPSYEEQVANHYPYTHRTLIGPYGDQEQVAIKGAKGMPIADVIGALNKHMLALDLSTALTGKAPSNKPKAGRRNSGRNRHKKGKGK